VVAAVSAAAAAALVAAAVAGGGGFECGWRNGCPGGGLRTLCTHGQTLYSVVIFFSSIAN